MTLLIQMSPWTLNLWNYKPKYTTLYSISCFGFRKKAKYFFYYQPIHFCLLSLCPLVSLAKGLSILLIFLREPVPRFFNCLYSSFCFYLFDFSPEFVDFLPSTPLGCITRPFSCAVKLLVYALSSFSLEALRGRSFPLSTAFIVSHKFGYVLP